MLFDVLQNIFLYLCSVLVACMQLPVSFHSAVTSGAHTARSLGLAWATFLQNWYNVGTFEVALHGVKPLMHLTWHCLPGLVLPLQGLKLIAFPALVLKILFSGGAKA